MPQRLDIAAALTQAALEINATRDLDSTLAAIVQTAARSLDGIDHVGISITHRDGKVETQAGTDQLVWDVDQLQYDLGEGPCLDAIKEAGVVWVNDLRQDRRWPRYVPQAVEYGIEAQLGLRLYADEQAAELFAAHAALALGRARTEDQLNAALRSRKVIGQGIGIVMERFGLDEFRRNAPQG